MKIRLWIAIRELVEILLLIRKVIKLFEIVQFEYGNIFTSNAFAMEATTRNAEAQSVAGSEELRFPAFQSRLNVTCASTVPELIWK